MPPLARLSFLWPFKKLLIFGVKFILFCGCQLSTHSHTHTLVENCYVSVGQQCKKPKMTEGKRQKEGETERGAGCCMKGLKLPQGLISFYNIFSRAVDFCQFSGCIFILRFLLACSGQITCVSHGDTALQRLAIKMRRHGLDHTNSVN